MATASYTHESDRILVKKVQEGDKGPKPRSHLESNQWLEMQGGHSPSLQIRTLQFLPSQQAVTLEPLSACREFHTPMGSPAHPCSLPRGYQPFLLQLTWRAGRGPGTKAWWDMVTEHQRDAPVLATPGDSPETWLSPNHKTFLGAEGCKELLGGGKTCKPQWWRWKGEYRSLEL